MDDSTGSICPDRAFRELDETGTFRLLERAETDAELFQRVCHDRAIRRVRGGGDEQRPLRRLRQSSDASEEGALEAWADRQRPVQ